MILPWLPDDFPRKLDRLKRSTTNRDVLDICLTAERLLNELRTNQEHRPRSVPVPERDKDTRKERRRVYMRDLMRRIRARDKTKREKDPSA